MGLKSLRTKFMILIGAGVLSTAIVIGLFVVLIVSPVLERNAVDYMNLTCEKESEAIDSIFDESEFSVNVAAYQADNMTADLHSVTASRQSMLSFSEAMERTMLNILRNTSNNEDFYLYLNSDYFPKAFGVYWSRVTASSFRSVIPPDRSTLDPDNPSHGWYFAPLEKNGPVWVGPYFDDKGKKIISYCTPVYSGEVLIGIVGIDLNLGNIDKKLSEISIFKSGYAVLLDQDNTVVYHKDLAPGSDMIHSLQDSEGLFELLDTNGTGNSLAEYRLHGERKCAAFRKLNNGMKLMLVAPLSEKNETRTILILSVAVSGICLTVISFVVMLFLLRKVIDPLKELTEASKKIAAEDLDVELTYYGHDEVGILEDSFRTTVSHLKRYMSKMSGYAYKDSLTGVQNKRAYTEAVETIEKRIETDEATFGVVVFDVNGLKETNDVYGHTPGDELLRQVSDAIATVLKHSPVFRIGGDEFVAILERTDLENRDQLFKDLDSDIDCRNRENDFPFLISAAKGFALFERGRDRSFEDVFKRADKAMYEDKARIKAHWKKRK